MCIPLSLWRHASDLSRSGTPPHRPLRRAAAACASRAIFRARRAVYAESLARSVERGRIVRLSFLAVLVSVPWTTVWALSPTTLVDVAIDCDQYTFHGEFALRINGSHGPLQSWLMAVDDAGHSGPCAAGGTVRYSEWSGAGDVVEFHVVCDLFEYDIDDSLYAVLLGPPPIFAQFNQCSVID